MLGAWLGDVTLDRFIESYLGREALARNGSIASPRALFGWRDLADVLANEQAESFVVGAGELVSMPPPRDYETLVALLSSGAGVFVRDAERAHPRLAALAASFAPELGAARVQIFATPGGTHGFRWHYDDEDVFVAQLAGIKDYYLRENTIARGERARSNVFARFRDETSTLQLATLERGDFLYIPSRWWHMAESRQTALSLSIGLRVSASPDLHAARTHTDQAM
ncbi:MAG TPA: cupin domain-containing protein [Kofleriaceae bacterium]